MSLVSLKTELRQDLKLTPQLLQSMEVLQMNSQELLEYLNKISEENPLVEQEDAHALRSAYEELRQKASWIDAGIHGGTFAHDESTMPERGAADSAIESLSAFLCDQLDRKRLPKPLLALSKYIAELVDEDGYLAQEDLDGLLEMMAAHGGTLEAFMAHVESTWYYIEAQVWSQSALAALCPEAF